MSSFLSRWAQRKAETARPEASEPPLAPEAPAALGAALGAPTGAPQGVASEPSPAGSPALTDDNPLGLPSEELEARLGALPKVEEITASTDLRPFLQDFVPKALKNAAMRRAWMLDPVISTHLDVARDYAWDFNTGTGPEGYYAEIGKDLVDRSLAALKGRVEPVEAEAATEQPEPELTEGDDQKAVIAMEPIEPIAKPDVRKNITQKHGGALPS